jgi:3-isopropylmalate/(R)-2-methylmalate dehydratase small subunit
MEPFTILTSRAIALPDADIDTDIIFPARFLLITSKMGLGQYAFHDRRREADGSVIAGSPFEDPDSPGAAVLITGPNFGCGSSREQAVWALRDLGLRCIVSSGFGEIFASNCFVNGVLPIVVEHRHLSAMMDDAVAHALFTVNLEAQTLSRPDRPSLDFTVPAGRKAALLNGWDEVTEIVSRHGEAIAEFEVRQCALRPWLYTGD